MKITLLKSNYGSISTEKGLASRIEKVFNGSEVSLSETEMKCETNEGIITLSLQRFNDKDPFNKVYVTTLWGELIRICKTEDSYVDLLDNHLTFASGYSNGFAIHFEVEE